MNARRLTAATAALLLVLTGCTGGGDAPEPDASEPATATQTSPTGSPTPEPTGTPDPGTSQPPVSYGTAPTSMVPTERTNDYHVATARVGSHDGFDRVTIELAGGSADGLEWIAEFDPNPATQGKGEEVNLPGEATLAVILRGLVTPPPVDPPIGLLPDSATGVVSGVHADPVFEGQAVFFIGLERETGFHVFTLDSPTRLVVDFETEPSGTAVHPG